MLRIAKDRRMKLKLLLTLAVTATLIVAHTSIAGEHDDEAVLRNFKTVLWPQAYRTQDVDLLDRMLHDRFQMLDAVGNRSTKADELDWVSKKAWDPGTFEYRIERLEIFMGSFAVIDGTGEAERYSYKSSNFLVKEDGEWRAIASHVSGFKEKGGAAPSAPFNTSWPGDSPELFAPGVVNTDGVEINLVFNAEYTELFFARTEDKAFSIYTSRLVDGNWTEPERLDLYPEGSAGEAVDMALSPDEQLLYFLGITPEGEGSQADIWVSERTDAGWSLARRLGPEVNTEHSEFYPVVVADGSLYFVSDRPHELGQRILFRAARRDDGGFEQAVPTGPPIDSELGKGDTYVSPDERYLIFSSRDRGGYGSGDLFISFRTADGGWTEPRNMGPEINTAELEFCPMVSPDGRWFSFSRRYGETWPTTTDAEIFWMDAGIIEDLRSE